MSLTHRRIVYTLRHAVHVRSETKRGSNLEKHGFGLADAPRVFAGPTYTYEDNRLDYPEQRFVTLGLLDDLVVSIIHTENPRLIRVISLRKATKHEQAIFFKNL